MSQLPRIRVVRLPRPSAESAANETGSEEVTSYLDKRVLLIEGSQCPTTARLGTERFERFEKLDLPWTNSSSSCRRRKNRCSHEGRS